MPKFFSFLFLMSFFLSSFYGNPPLTQHIGEHAGWTSMYSLPQSEVDQHFAEVKEAVDQRWSLLATQYDFPLYSFQRDDSSLIEEFYHFSNLRVQLWLEDPSSFPCRSNPFFKVSQSHVNSGNYRQSCCITFEHSATDPSYNSTSVSFGKRRFFALEGPKEEHVASFLQLLTNWNVSYVVCLTDEDLKSGVSRCHPYWKTYSFESEGKSFLNIPIIGEWKQFSSWENKKVPYLFWEGWQDHHGIDPQRLVEAVNQVRIQTSENEIIAVHCSAGVGRTGTFISAICLLDEIDEQLSIGISPDEIQLSIAKLFFYLNFHRPWLIAKPSQYLTLYKTVDWYLAQKKKEHL